MDDDGYYAVPRLMTAHPGQAQDHAHRQDGEDQVEGEDILHPPAGDETGQNRDNGVTHRPRQPDGAELPAGLRRILQSDGITQGDNGRLKKGKECRGGDEVGKCHGKLVKSDDRRAAQHHGEEDGVL